MRVAEVLKRATVRLGEAGIRSPQLDAELILSHLLGLERINLHIYPEREISREMCQKFWEKVEKREKRMPAQYIVNNQEFMGLDFWVEEGVLIPRPDTEILVEKVIEIYQDHYGGKKLQILDMGFGSGAIAISLGKYIEEAMVFGVDISPKAFELAERNALKHGVGDRVKFFQGDLFKGLENANLQRAFDLIVSNPPYIKADVLPTLGPEVRDYEPGLALDGGRDGLCFYRRILEGVGDFLNRDGWLAVEIGYDQGQAVKKMMADKGFANIGLVKDLAGLDRVVVGRLV